MSFEDSGGKPLVTGVEGEGGRMIGLHGPSINSSSQNTKSLASFEILSDSRPALNLLDFIFLLMRILGHFSSVLMK